MAEENPEKNDQIKNIYQLVIASMSVDTIVPLDVMISVRTMDDVVMQIPRSLAMKCRTLSDLLVDMGDDFEFPLDKVDSFNFKNIVTYLDNHKADKKIVKIEEQYEGKDVNIDNTELPVDIEYFNNLNLVPKQLIELITAANYMANDDMVDSCAKQIASRIRGNTPAQMREFFDVEEDWSPEEKAEALDTCSWMNEK
jgi:S-phase kinase-associated protein 1